MGSGSSSMSKFPWSSYVDKIYNETSCEIKKVEPDQKPDESPERTPGLGIYSLPEYWLHFPLNEIFNEPDGFIMFGCDFIEKTTKTSIDGNITCRLIEMRHNGLMYFVQFLKHGKPICGQIRGINQLEAITEAVKAVKQLGSQSIYKADNVPYKGLQDVMDLDENLLLGNVVLYANAEPSILLKCLAEVAKKPWLSSRLTYP
jgi:hypothetical protein